MDLISRLGRDLVATFLGVDVAFFCTIFAGFGRDLTATFLGVVIFLGVVVFLDLDLDLVAVFFCTTFLGLAAALQSLE